MALQVVHARRHRTLVWSTRVGILAVLAVAWEVFSAAEGGLFIPGLAEIAGALGDLGRTSELWEGFYKTNVSLLIGYPLCVLLGVPLGLLLGRVRSLDRFFGFSLDLFLVIPTIAVVPVIIAALGLSTAARVLVVVMFALPVVAMNARAAVRVLDQGRIEMARSFDASRLTVWTKVIFPDALGAVFAGLRLGLSRAVSAMIVVELMLVPVGLGGFIVDYSSRFQSAEVYAITVLIIAEGVLLVAAVRAVERRLERRMRGATR
jgi:ABC-type nitrate/sulfonate/bicarbonate transport system permease component